MSALVDRTTLARALMNAVHFDSLGQYREMLSDVVGRDVLNTGKLIRERTRVLHEHEFSELLERCEWKAIAADRSAER